MYTDTMFGKSDPLMVTPDVTYILWGLLWRCTKNLLVRRMGTYCDIDSRGIKQGEAGNKITRDVKVLSLGL
jgi:hypothetical protein